MKNKPFTVKTIIIYLNALLLLMLIGGGTYYAVRLYTRGQTCYSPSQVQQDSRCLYIYKDMVFEKGTKDAPHQGIPCGTDVTSQIPDSHILDKVGHLDPNYQGAVCANQPAATATPQPSPTSAPTNTPIPAATNTPFPPTPTTGSTGASNPTATPTTASSTTTVPSPTTRAIGGSNVAASTATPTVTTTLASNFTPTPTTFDETATDSASPTEITSLPVTGRLEWAALAVIPLGLVFLGMIF